MKNFTKYTFCFFIFVVMVFYVSVSFAETPGVTDKRILLGSTLDQSGPSAFATKMFLVGIDAYFKKVNDAGGVHGREIEMTYEDGKYNFKNAKTMLLFCNGVWCPQSTWAIENLLKIGYPKEKLMWYRGGMYSWKMLNLTSVIPE